MAYPESTDRSAFVLALLLFVLFGAVSVGFWAYFRYRRAPAPAPALVSGPEEMVTAGDQQ